MTSHGDSAKASSINTNTSLSNIIGFYKRQAWAQKVFEKIGEVETDEGNGIILAASLLRSRNGLYFPAYLSINKSENGKVVGVYLLSESEESFNLIPLETFSDALKEEDLLPFQYRTIEKVEGDTNQVNWPDFT